MDITKIIIKLLPWLFSLAKKIWANLSKGKKDTIAKAIKAGQVIKSNLIADPDAVIRSIAIELSIPIETVLAALTGVAIAIRRADLSPQDIIKIYQVEASVSGKVLDEFVRYFVTGIGGEEPTWEELTLGAVKAGFEILKEKGELR